MERVIYYLFIFVLVISSCTTSKESFHPEAKYPPSQLREDYELFQNILQESHPSLYWYATKDSMDYYFNKGIEQIKDSMTEPAFKTLLSYVITKIDCGHTSTKLSKTYSHFLDTAKLQSFPLSLKLWRD